MAINELSVTTIERNSTDDASAILTWQQIDSATGAYVDVSDLKGDRIAFLVQRDTEAKDGGVRIGAGNRSDGNIGFVNIALTTDNAGSVDGERVRGPIYVNTARCKDSNDRINIYASYSSDADSTPTTVQLYVACVYLKDM